MGMGDASNAAEAAMVRWEVVTVCSPPAPALGLDLCLRLSVSPPSNRLSSVIACSLANTSDQPCFP